MITLKKIGYILATASMLIGGNLWFERSNHSVEPQDISELMNGLQERCIATKSGSYPTNFTGIVTNDSVYSIVEDNKATDFFYIGTNKQYYSNPKLVKSLNYTNKLVSNDWQFYGKYVSPPYAVVKTITDYNYSNKWVYGAFETLTIGGFDDATFNGVYTYQTNQWHTFSQIYQNENGKILQMDGWYSWFHDDNFSAYTMTYAPWFHAPVENDCWDNIYTQDNFYITCSKGAISTNCNIIDLPLVNNQFIYDWIIPNRLPSFDEFLGIIDRYIFGEVRMSDGWNGSPANSNCFFYSFQVGSPAFVYAPYWYPACTTAVNDAYGSGYNSSFYIEPSKYGVSSFDKVADLRMDLSGWGLASTNYYGITVYGFDDNLPLPLGYNSLSGDTNSLKYTITKHQLQQRYDVLKKLNTYCQLSGVTGNPKWVHTTTNNQYHVQGYGLGHSLNEAYSRACSGATNYSYGYSVDGQPYAYSYGQYTTNTSYDDNGNLYLSYNVFIHKKVLSTALIIDLSTNIETEAGYYAKSTAHSFVRYESYSTNDISIFNDFGTGMISNKFVKFDSVEMGNHGAITSKPISGIDFLSVGELKLNKWTFKGFVVNNQCLIEKFNFKYCIK